MTLAFGMENTVGIGCSRIYTKPSYEHDELRRSRIEIIVTKYLPPAFHPILPSEQEKFFLALSPFILFCGIGKEESTSIFKSLIPHNPNTPTMDREYRF